MEGLVACGLLTPCTNAKEWILLEIGVVPLPPPGYVISFIYFHESGFTVPAHPFFRGLLHHYDLKL